MRYDVHQFRYHILLSDVSLTQFWKKNMPDALDSGRVKLQGPSYSIHVFPRDERRCSGFSSPRFLRPSASAGGRYRSVSSVQDSPRLGGRILRQNFEATASRRWAQDPASHYRTTDSVRLRRTGHARNSRRGALCSPQTPTSKLGSRGLVCACHRCYSEFYPM
jgi:hypothetical protein